MEMPKKVYYAITAICIMTIVWMIVSFINVKYGNINKEEFISQVIFYSIFLIFPYKFSKRSNASRYIYLVMTLGSLLIWAAFPQDFQNNSPKLDYVLSILSIPVDFLILYWLFASDSFHWFQAKKDIQIS